MFPLLSSNSKINVITSKIGIMAPSAYQMSIMAPRAPYSRIPSDPSAGSPPEAFQDFSVPQGDPQPRHRVPRHSLRSWAHLMKTKFWNKDSRLYILLTKPFLRLLGTAAFIASILETLDSYERKGNFSKHQKTLFSGITTALILGLGLNLFVSRRSAPGMALGYP